jgi:hypothetical protein
VTFTLELRWRVLTAAGLVALLVLAVALIYSTVGGELWFAIAAAPVVLLTALGLVRVWRVGVSYDSRELKTRGLLWTRVVPREAITFVNREPNHASVTWKDARGRTRTTWLTALWGNNYGWLPVYGNRARRKFLNQVAGWARK